MDGISNTFVIGFGVFAGLFIAYIAYVIYYTYKEAVKEDEEVRRPNRPPPIPPPPRGVIAIDYQHVVAHRDELAKCTYYRCADCGGSIYTLYDYDGRNETQWGQIRENFHKAYKLHQCTPLPATEPTAEPEKKEYVRLIRFTAKEETG